MSFTSDDTIQDYLSTVEGQPNGLATLDGSGQIPIGQLPASVQSGVNYKGTWDANANSPALSNSGGGGDGGDYYRVSVAGTTSIDGINDWQVGDWIIHNGTVWEKVDNTDQVSSVAGKTGAVTLVAADIGDFDTEVSNNTDVAANTSKVSADGSVTTHSDVTDAGSGAIITTAERGNLHAPPVSSSTTAEGIIELATQAEVDLGTDAVRAVTPVTLANTTLSLPPASHTHTASDVTDFDTEVSNNTDVAANTLKVSADGSVTTHSDVTSAGSGAIITVGERSNLHAPPVTATEIVEGIAEVATQIETDAGLADDKIVTPLKLKNTNLTFAPSAHNHDGGDITTGVISTARLPAATTAAAGTVEVATQAEVDLGTDTTRSVSPATLAGTSLTFTPSAHTHDAADVTSGTFADARISESSVTQHVSPVTVEDEGTPLTTGAKKINFAGSGVTATEPIADEILVTIPGGVGSDELVKVSSNDTTAGFLADKLIGTTNKITVTEVGDGGDEDLQVGIGTDVFDKAVDDAADVPYTPTVGADWPDPDPTEIGGALDSLADRSLTSDCVDMIVGPLGDQWESGLAVTANSPADKMVDIAAGVFYIDCVKYNHGGTANFDLTADFTALSGGFRQIATLYIDNTNVVQRVLGTAETGSKKAEPAAHPANSICLAYVKLDKDKGTVDTEEITDCRMNIGGSGGSIVDTDELVRVSADATTAKYLDGALTAGTGITLTVNNPGADEDLAVSTNDAAIDHDALQNFVANEHIDWTTDQGATNVHLDNVEVLVGDSGSGGTKGLVPAPAAGDAAAGKYLDADGTWTTPPAGGSGMVTGVSKNSGANVNAADRAVLNFIEGSGVTLTITDDAAGDEVDITIAASGGGGGSNDIIVTTQKHSSHYKSDAGTSYVTLAAFAFPGSTAYGTPVNIKASTWVDGGSTGKLRIYDLTNALVIAEITTLSNTTESVIDLGTISNVPTGEAVWQIQHAGNGAQATNTSSVWVKF